MIADVRQSKAPGAVMAVLNRVWPSMVVALAIVANVVWIGVLGYALVALLALARSGQKGQLRNSRLRMLRLRTPNASHGERLTCRVRFLVASAPTIVSQAAQGCVGFAKPPRRFTLSNLLGDYQPKPGDQVRFKPIS